MQVSWADLPEAGRRDEVVAMLGRLGKGEVLTIVFPDDPTPHAERILEKAGDAYDRQVIIAPHKKKPMMLVHLKRKHRPGAP